MKKYIHIELDRPRHLRYGINALCQLEKMTKKTVSDISKNPGIIELRAMLYCGLTWEDKKLILEEVGNMMDEVSDIEYISEKVGEAMELALGDDDKKKQKMIQE